MKKNLTTIVAVIIALAFFSFVGYKVYRDKYPIVPKQLNTVKITYQDDEVNTVALIDLAEEKGYFKQSGIQIDRKPGLKNVSTFLTSGQVDVVQGSLIPAMNDFFSNLDIKFLAITEKYTPSLRVVSRFPNDQISSVKNIAVNRLGGTLQNMSWLVSKNLGINVDSVKYVIAADPQATVALFDKGSVDLALVSNEEAYQKIMAQSGRYTIDTKTAYKDTVMPNGIYTASKVYGTKKKDIDAYVTDMKKASTYFDTHKSEMITFMSSKYSYSKTQSEDLYGRMTAAKTGANYSLNLDLLKDVISSVKTLNKPVNPDRNISELTK